MDLLLEDGRQEPRTLEAVLIKRFHSTPLSNAFSRITVHTFLPETVRRQYPREKKPLETPLVARSRLRACISTIRFAQPPFLELWRFNLLLPAIRASQAPKVFPSSKNIPLTFSIHLDSLGDDGKIQSLLLFLEYKIHLLICARVTIFSGSTDTNSSSFPEHRVN